MRRKRIISLLCAVTFTFMSGISAFAEELPEATELKDFTMGDTISANDIENQSDDGSNNLAGIMDETSPMLTEEKNVSLTEDASISQEDYNLDSGVLMGDLTTRKNARSAASITQEFTDFITAEGDYKFVQFSLNEGEIFNGSLVCPQNANLNYDLLLGRVADDGNITIIKESALGTYIDPNTGKTVDEGISFVHNQATEGNYAVLVLATTGSSSVDSFTLTVSLDTVGSYDGNEPNDSAFDATSISNLSVNGSLHVENDQDWYVADIKDGVYEAAAGDYQAEIYYATTGNVLRRAETSGKNFVLDDGTYYIKVFSDKKGEDFQFGNYTLQITDKSVYSTLQTAFDFGNWEKAYMKRPEIAPRGQRSVYYKFTIDEGDKAYASIILSQSEKGTLIEVLDNNGDTIDYGFSGSDEVTNIPVKGVVKKSNSTLTNLVVNIDGTQTNNVAYLRLTSVDRMDINGRKTPSLSDRTATGYADGFRISGTARNSGSGISSVLTVDLTNNSKIPPRAVVDKIITKSSISSSVGGVHHQLCPGSAGWFESVYTGAEKGTFQIGAERGIQARQPWQFRYAQTAPKSTTMSSVSMTIYWEYDIQYTNYELFK